MKATKVSICLTIILSFIILISASSILCLQVLGPTATDLQALGELDVKTGDLLGRQPNTDIRISIPPINKPPIHTNKLRAKAVRRKKEAKAKAKAKLAAAANALDTRTVAAPQGTTFLYSPPKQGTTGSLAAKRRSKKQKRQQRRRRIRQRRNRHQRLGAKSAALLGSTHPSTIGNDGTPPSQTVTALESIVEEVSRVQHQTSASLGTGELLHAAASGVPLIPSHSSPLSQKFSTSMSPLVNGGNNPIGQASGGTGSGGNSRGLFLTTVLSKIMNVLNVTEFAIEMRDGISSRASCMACNAVVGLFLSPLYSKEVFSAAIRTVCTSFKIQSARVCAGLVDAFQDDFEYIRRNTKLTRDEICAVVFGIECARRQTYNLFWTVPIPDYPPSLGGRPYRPASEQDGSHPIGQPLQPPIMPVPIGPPPFDPQPDLGDGHLPPFDHGDAPDVFEDRRIPTALLTSSSKSPHQAAASPSLSHPTSIPSSYVNSSSSSSSSSLLTTPMMGETTLQAAASSSTTSTASGNLNACGSTRRCKKQATDENPDLSSDISNSKQTSRPLSNFVQITDIHIDPYYEPGSLNDCHEALCCRATSGMISADKRRRAGRWGDYGNCDTPIRTLKSALERIKTKHSDAEYWLWTGDISPHDIWNITKAETLNHVRLVSKMMRSYANVPVYPTIGNHEAHPVNSFSPPEIKGKFSMSWLYNAMAEEWSQWLPKDALRTLKIGGYYKLKVRPGFRILSINTNYCARLNPWSFYDPVDPAGQLKWLASELLEAERNNDKVHIIGHVPPDNRECTQAWLFNFINIVDRFRDTILAQFYGHTHRDEFRVIYSIEKTDEPVGVQYIGPSITPFTENNPAYRIYHQDSSGYLFDFETYYFNLTQANEAPIGVEPKWKFGYRVHESLNMTHGLSPSEWNTYIKKMYDSDELFDEFYKNFYRSSDVKSDAICRNKCKFSRLSDLQLLHPYKTKPKPFSANRKTSSHHQSLDEHWHNRNQHNSGLRRHHLHRHRDKDRERFRDRERDRDNYHLHQSAQHRTDQRHRHTQSQTNNPQNNQQ